jgi:[protein-PII] uridylyltransferase
VDRPGLLHALGATLRDLAVDVRSAHVATHGGRAVDVLYLTQAGAEPGRGRLSAARTGAVVGALMAAATWEPAG